MGIIIDEAHLLTEKSVESYGTIGAYMSAERYKTIPNSQVVVGAGLGYLNIFIYLFI